MIFSHNSVHSPPSDLSSETKRFLDLVLITVTQKSPIRDSWACFLMISGFVVILWAVEQVSHLAAAHFLF